ncbi:hypothetical protein GF314_13555 [bacterium]|nr:hypothetical protein [bacterium]
MNTSLRTILRTVVLVAATVAIAAQVHAGDGRAHAMGGAYTAAARGLDAATWNPASLAFSPGGGLGLAGAALDLSNNSFTLARYNEVSGAELSQADKERLLADIPEEGFRLDTTALGSGVGVHVGNLAITTRAVAAGRGNLDRDFFDLVLFGNELGETVDFADTWGDGYAVAKAGLSWGQPIYEGALGRMAVGATASYLYGAYEMHVDEAYGSLTTSMSEIRGEAFVAATTAAEGRGLGLDLGATWLAPGGWSFGLALDNVLGSVSWTGDVERHEMRVTAADLNALNDDLDDAVADADTSYAVDGYSTNLPRRLRLGVAHDSGSLLLAADWVQGLEDRAGSSITPQINLGVEWRPLGFLAPRGGMMLGGAGGFGLAGGVGLDLWWLEIDLAVSHRGGFSGGDTRGLGFGLSTQLIF